MTRYMSEKIAIGHPLLMKQKQAHTRMYMHADLEVVVVTAMVTILL